MIIHEIERGVLRLPLLIAGGKRESVEAAQAVQPSERSGYEVAGLLLDLDAGTGTLLSEGLPILGTAEDFDTVIAEHRIGVVLF